MSSEPSYKGMEAFAEKYRELLKNDALSGNTVTDYKTVLTTLTDLSNAEKAELLVNLYRNNLGVSKYIIDFFNALQFKNLENENDNTTINMLFNINESYKTDHSQTNGFLSEDINNRFIQILQIGTQPKDTETSQVNPSNVTPPLPSPPLPLGSQFNNPRVQWIADRLGEKTFKDTANLRADYTNRAFVKNRTFNTDTAALPMEKLGENAMSEINKAQEPTEKIKQGQHFDTTKSILLTLDLVDKVYELVNNLKKDINDDEFEKLIRDKSVNLNSDEIEVIKREINVGYYFLALNKIFPVKGTPEQVRLQSELQEIFKQIGGELNRSPNITNPEDLYQHMIELYKKQLSELIDTTLTHTISSAETIIKSIVNSKNFTYLGDDAKQLLQDKINKLPPTINKIHLQKEFNQYGLGKDSAAINTANLELQFQVSRMPMNVERIQLQREMNEQLWGNPKRAQEVNRFLQVEISKLNPNLDTIRLQKEFNEQILGQESTIPNEGNKTLQKKISDLPPSFNKMRLQYEFNTQIMGATSLRDRFTSALSSVAGVLRERMPGNKSGGASETAPTTTTETTTASSTGGTPENPSNKSPSFWRKLLFAPPKKETPTGPVTDLANLYASTSPKESVDSQTQKDTSNRLDANKNNKWQAKKFNENPDTRNLQNKLFGIRNEFMDELRDIIDPQTQFTIHRATQTIKEALLPRVESIRTEHPGENNQKLITNTLQALAQELSDAIRIEEEACRKTMGVDQSGKPKQKSDKLDALNEVRQLLEKQGIQPPSAKNAAAVTTPPKTPDAAKPAGAVETVRSLLRF